MLSSNQGVSCFKHQLAYKFGLARLQVKGTITHDRKTRADVAQLAERVLGKDEVTGSIPVIGSSI